MPPFCKMPWVSLKVDVERNMRPCCNFLGTLGKFKSPQDIEDYMVSPGLEDLKRRMLSGEVVPECQTCVTEEGLGLYTDRIDSLKRFPGEPEVIEELDLAVTNKCNMVCVMCTPRFSSKWESVEKEINEKLSWTKPSYYSGTRYSMTVESVEELTPLLKKIKWLRLIGGEPFSSQAITRLLEIWRGFTHERRLTIVTNVSLIKDNHMRLMKDIPGMDLSCSIDGTGDIFEWIRGYSWNEVERLMLRMKEMNVALGVVPTVQLANAFNVFDLYRWGLRNEIPVKLTHFLSAPEYLAVRALPGSHWPELQDQVADLAPENGEVYSRYLAVNSSGFENLGYRAGTWIREFDSRRKKSLAEIDSKFVTFASDS